MIALFGTPLTARLVRNEEPALLLGVVAHFHPNEAIIGGRMRFLAVDRDGGVSLVDISDVIADWRYQHIPERSAMGWEIYFHEEERSTIPQPDEGLDDDAP